MAGEAYEAVWVVVVQDVTRDSDRVLAEVDELVGDQYSGRIRVGRNVFNIGGAVGIAVVAGGLKPRACCGVAMVDVVAAL